MKNQKERGRRSYSEKGWKPPGGLSQGEIPLHYKDTGAQDLSHFLVERTAALWDVHEEKHKKHSEDILDWTNIILYQDEINTDSACFQWLFHTNAFICIHTEWKTITSNIQDPDSLNCLRKTPETLSC